MTTPPEVLHALKHVRTLHPEVVRVIYSPSGFSLYVDRSDCAVTFDGRIDISILDAGSAAVPSFPATYVYEAQTLSQQLDSIAGDLEDLRNHLGDVTGELKAQQRHALYDAWDRIDSALDLVRGVRAEV